MRFLPRYRLYFLVLATVVIAVPVAVANSVAHRLIDAGVTGLLNLAPCHLDVPVPVINVDLSSSLEELAWAMTVED